MNWNRSFTGIVILAISLILVVSAPSILREWERRQPGMGDREPLPGLRYCSPGGLSPCVESFSLNPRGGMVVYMQTTDLSAPDFNLRIRHAEREKLYACRRPDRSSLRIICTGDAMPVGQELLLLMVSKEDDAVLAAGTLSIIGMALATPDLATTPTSVPLFERPPR